MIFVIVHEKANDIMKVIFKYLKGSLLEFHGSVPLILNLQSLSNCSIVSIIVE